MNLKIPNNSIVSINELNKVLEQYKDAKTHEKIEILFLNSIEKFDIVFIAGLILLWHNYKTKFRIEYSQPLPEARIFEVRQYIMLYQKMFNIDWKSIFESFKMITELTDNDYRASESFSPIIFISKDTINNFFYDSKVSQINLEVFTLREKYINEKISHHNLKEELYLKSPKSIKNKLLGYPPIYTFVFSVLYNKISPFVKSTEKGIKNPSERIEQLWEFTKEYVKGLCELAKNIVEHSSTSQGMITIRAYEDSESIDKVLETYVFDYGTKGIIPKIIEDTKRNIGLGEIYSEDIKILNSDFILRDFIEPTVKTKLNQQLFREIAHYGLMKFYKLIKRNEGVVVASSISKNNQRDVFNPSDFKIEKVLIIGTSYYFQLPFKHELFKSIDSISQTIELQGSLQTIGSINELIKLKILKENEVNDTNENVLRIIEPELEIKNRSDEELLFRRFVKIKEEKNVEYIAINFVKLTLSDSSLLRFLAHLSTNYSQGIIIYNLEFEIFDEMIENNKQVFRTLKDLENNIPYWYENKGILVYTLLKDLNFNFADMLFGINEIEMQTVNNIINHTFPNSISNSEQMNLISENDFIIPECLNYYFHKSTLLPFDILLYNSNNKLLFQSNLEALLMQNMNMNKTELL